MSWLSEFVHNPGQFITHEPWKAAALIGLPLAAVAAPFAAPAIGGALALGEGAAAGAGLFGAAEGAGALGAAEGLGALGAAEGAGALGGEALGFSAAEGGLDTLAGVGSGTEGALDNWLTNPGALGGSDLTGADGLTSFADASSELPNFNGNGTSFADRWSAISDSASGMPDISGPAGGEAAPLGGAPAPQGAAIGDASALGGDNGFFGNMWDSAKNYAVAHPFQTAGAGLAGLGLANNLISGQRVSPEMKALQQQAGQMNAQAQKFMSYLQNGNLPPGLQAVANQAKQAMRARAIANAARNGMPTNPQQNSALAQELNGIDQQIFGMIAQQGVQMLNSGMKMADMSQNLYTTLEKLNRDQSKQTGIAIANFAAALNGSGSMRRAA